MCIRCEVRSANNKCAQTTTNVTATHSFVISVTAIFSVHDCTSFNEQTHTAGAACGVVCICVQMLAENFKANNLIRLFLKLITFTTTASTSDDTISAKQINYISNRHAHTK